MRLRQGICVSGVGQVSNLPHTALAAGLVVRRVVGQVGNLPHNPLQKACLNLIERERPEPRRIAALSKSRSLTLPVLQNALTPICAPLICQ